MFAQEVRTVKPDRCEYCGADIEDTSVEYRGHFFCSDECCDEYEAHQVANGEPDPDELDDEDLKDIEIEEMKFAVDSDLDADYDDDDAEYDTYGTE